MWSHRSWAIGGASFIVILIVLSCIVTVLKIDLTPREGTGSVPKRTHDFGEGIRVSQHGLYGIDLITLGHAHMRKLKKGPFTIGAINELVLEDLSIIWPGEQWQSRGKESGSAVVEAAGDAPRAILSRLGVETGSIRIGGKIPRFSALTIYRLSVAELKGDKVVPWFSASVATAEEGGLALESCNIVQSGVTNFHEKAFLKVYPRPHLVL